MRALTHVRGRAPSALILTALLLGLGCSHSAPAPVGPSPTYDRSVTEAVRGVLQSETPATQQITISTQNGIVTLRGVVDDLFAKEQLARLAETVRGVRSVINLIEVVPEGSPSDATIRAAVENALHRDPVTRKARIRVAVFEGHVALQGTVTSMAEARLAEHVAERVEGVRSVEDNLELDLSQPRSDRDIESEIEARLAYDPWIDEELIAVQVRHGKVRLAGSVGRIAERNRATAEAWVRGVRAVSVDDLHVEPWSRDPERRPRGDVWLTPEEIARAVELSLFYDPRVQADSIHVHVAGSTVTLVGTAEDSAARLAASEDAAASLGVEHVNNRVVVQHPRPPDAVIASRLTRAIADYPLLDGDPIRVSVADGIVQLTGMVRSLVERRAVDRLAQTTPDATAVLNELTIEPAPLPIKQRPVGVYHRPSSREDIVEPGMQAKPNYSLALAQCQHEQRCGFVGQAHRYESVESCVNEVLHSQGPSLAELTCDPEESPAGFALCLSAVRTRDCVEPVASIAGLSECLPARVCRAAAP